MTALRAKFCDVRAHKKTEKLGPVRRGPYDRARTSDIQICYPYLKWKKKNSPRKKSWSARVHIQSQSLLVDPYIEGVILGEWGALYRARRFADGKTNVSVLAIETAIQADH